MLCPKCHRALEDESDGQYICCADSHLQWRCKQCAKLSEGFAFPYGRCPGCGGELEMLDDPGTAQESALEGVRMAFAIELGGRAFYQRAAADAAEPQMRALFGRFARMEGEHMETLSRRYHLDIPDPSPAFKVELAALFAGVTSRPEDPDNLFRIAVGLEQRAAAFFGERAERSAQGSAEQRLFRELAAEEREHADTLGTEHRRWRARKPGLYTADTTDVPAPTVAAQAGTLNAAALLLDGHDAKRAALCCGGRTIDRGTLRERVARCAGLWRSRGIATGERVAIKLDDGFDWVEAMLGTMWAGAVAVAVNPRIPAGEWAYILDEAGFSLILADSADDTPSPWSDRVLRLADWRDGMRRAAPIEPQAMSPNAPALWCHSSGTSGKPKAVLHAHRFAQQIERVSRDGLGLVADDRLYASSRLFFVYPQANSLFAGLKLGATVLLDPAWPSAASVAAGVAASHPTVLFSVPSLYRNLLHEGLAPQIAGCGVRLCVSAGETLPASLRDAWLQQTGLRIVSGYGASETMALAMIDRGDGRGFMASPGSQVAPLQEVPPGAPTRLTIRTPTLALGYLDRPQAEAESFRGGAFCAADLFVANDGGGWRFAGREDSLVKIGGRWVDLAELEERLGAGNAGVRDAAAVCVADADGVDAIAFFYIAGDAAAAAAALQERSQALPRHQRPRWLHAVDALPRSATGKLVRHHLQKLHRSLVAAGPL